MKCFVFMSSQRIYIINYTIAWQLVPFQSLRQSLLVQACRMQSYIHCPWMLSARKLIFFQRSWKSGLHLGYNSTRYLALIEGNVNGFLNNYILFNIGNIGSRTTTHHWKWFLLVELPSLCIYTRGVRTDCSHRSTLRGWAAFWASTSVHSSYWCRNKHQTDISQQSLWQNYREWDNKTISAASV